MKIIPTKNNTISLNLDTKPNNISKIKPLSNNNNPSFLSPIKNGDNKLTQPSQSQRNITNNSNQVSSQVTHEELSLKHSKSINSTLTNAYLHIEEIVQNKSFKGTPSLLEAFRSNLLTCLRSEDMTLRPFSELSMSLIRVLESSFNALVMEESHQLRDINSTYKPLFIGVDNMPNIMSVFDNNHPLVNNSSFDDIGGGNFSDPETGKLYTKNIKKDFSWIGQTKTVYLNDCKKYNEISPDFRLLSNKEMQETEKMLDITDTNFKQFALKILISEEKDKLFLMPNSCSSLGELLNQSLSISKDQQVNRISGEKNIWKNDSNNNDPNSFSKKLKTGSRIEFNYLLDNKDEYKTDKNGNLALVDDGGLNISYHVTTVIDVKNDGSFLTISANAGDDLTHPYFEHWKSLDDLIKHENNKVNNLLKNVSINNNLRKSETAYETMETFDYDSQVRYGNVALDPKSISNIKKDDLI